MRFAIVSCVVLISLLVVQTRAQDIGGEPVHKLRKIESVKPATQKWQSQDVIRNGDFDYGKSAWAMKGGLVGVSVESGRSGEKTDFGVGIHVTSVFSTQGYFCQMLHLPNKTTAGTLKLDWRLASQGDNPVLQALTFSIGSFDDKALFKSAATIKEVNAKNFPGWEWQKIEHKLTEAELKAINTMHKAKLQLVLIASISGDNLQLDTDNVSLKVDGEFTPPKTPTFIAYGETHRIKGPDGGRDRFEVNAASGDGSKRKNMFRTETSYVNSYGLAWRPDGNELCFSSDHEMAWSYFSANLFALDAKGMRRVTNPAGRDAILKDKRPTGKVKLKVRNLRFENVQGAVWIDGGRKVGTFSLLAFNGGDADEQEITINDVVDYGEGVNQLVIVRVGGKSAVTGVLIDVKSGETVESPGVVSVDNTLRAVNASSPNYLKDGKSIAFNAGGGFYTVDAAGSVPTSEKFGNLIGSSPAVSPKDDTLVYAAVIGGVWMLEPDSEQAVEIISGNRLGFENDLSWFPDASGLLFTSATSNQAGWGGRNICAYAFQNKQMVQLTDLFHEDVESPTLSPDGMWVAGIRHMSGNGNSKRELWVWKVGEPQTCWHIKTKGQPSNPAWCPK